MKIFVDAETDRVLGAAILSTEGGELIHILHTLKRWCEHADTRFFRTIPHRALWYTLIQWAIQDSNL